MVTQRKFLFLEIPPLLLLTALLAGCAPAGASPTAAPAPAGISPAEAYAQFQQGAFFLDVRTQPEWDQFHLQGSTLIPLEQLPAQWKSLPKDKNIVVICQTGQRSQQGAAILQQAGFTHVTYVTGGLQAWMAAGYPVQNGAH